MALEIKNQLNRVTNFKDNLKRASEIIGLVPILLFVNKKTSVEEIEATFEQVANQNNTWWKRLLNWITGRSTIICITIEPDMQNLQEDDRNSIAVLNTLMEERNNHRNVRSNV